MNNSRRKLLHRINIASKKGEVIVPEVVKIVEPVQEKVEKQLPVALKDEPTVQEVQVIEEVLVQEEVKEEVAVVETEEVKKNMPPKFKKYKKDVEVGE